MGEGYGIIITKLRGRISHEKSKKLRTPYGEFTLEKTAALSSKLKALIEFEDVD